MLALRLASALVMLSIASYKDWKDREVTDKLWIPFSAIGVVSNTLEFVQTPNSLNVVLSLTSVAITFVISLTLYHFGFFGGADMKALVALSLLIPIYYPSSNYLHPFAPIMILTNGALFTLVVPITLFFINTLRLLRGRKIFSGFEHEPRWKKILILFIGYRAKKAEERHYLMSLESLDDGMKRFHISFHGDFISGNDVWVTPGLPYLIFITVGFVLMVLFGDLIAILLWHLLP